jgi:hypothetical protein
MMPYCDPNVRDAAIPDGKARNVLAFLNQLSYNFMSGNQLWPEVKRDQVYAILWLTGNLEMNSPYA